jgi:hypothetical protein
MMAGAVTAQAGTIITSASKVSGNATAINLLDAGLVESVAAYTDRTHQLKNIPVDLLGGDLVQVSNDDKASDPYQVDVTVGVLSALYVGLDDRFAQPLAWMDDPAQTGLPTKFFNTGTQIDIDESADGDLDQTFTLWATIAPPGTYSLGVNGNSGNNYIIFGHKKIVPEPSSLTLVGVGLVGLLSVVRRRNRG